jgi:hypothetical protein
MINPYLFNALAGLSTSIQSKGQAFHRSRVSCTDELTESLLITLKNTTPRLDFLLKNKAQGEITKV